MSTMKTLLVTAIAAASASTAFAENISSRNNGMGGTGVASSNYDTASFTNPALMTQFKTDDDISVILPTLGIEASDKDEVFDKLDSIADGFDDLEDAIDMSNTAEAERYADEIISNLRDVDGGVVRLTVGGGGSITIPSKTFAVSAFATSRLDLGLMTSFSESDANLIDLAVSHGDSGLLDNVDSYALGIGAVVTEVGVSFAREFTQGAHRFAVGVTPKYQSVDTILYKATVKEYDQDEIDSDDYTSKDSNVNLDIGLAYFVNDNITVGFTVKDLISNDYKTTDYFDVIETYTIDPMATLGVSYRTDRFTAAIDAELTESEGFDFVDNSQMVRLGVEFDAWNWAQLRLGYRTDINDVREDVVTAGIGISPFGAFHLGLAASKGSNDTYGGSLEFKVTF